MTPNLFGINPYIQEEQTSEETKTKTSEAPTKIEGNNGETPTNKIEYNRANRRTISQILGFKTELLWYNVLLITLLHALGVYHILTFPYLKHPKTFVFGILYGIWSGFGVTAGVHRYWTHRAYKAKLPLQILMLIAFYSSGQNSIYDWVRDHRIHHKYSETDADPHNSNRGFFFSHVGWLMMRKHDEVKRRGRQMDFSDITNDPVVAFGEKYFVPLNVFFSFIVPCAIPVYFWNEEWYYAIVAQVFIRYPITLNIIWSVNSVAHIWGSKPYDKSIKPVENKFVAILAIGEGWHNYHHTFPWDYKAAEFGNYRMNLTTMILDGFAKIGWAYHLKEPSPMLIKAVIAKKGDRLHPRWEEVPEPTPEEISHDHNS